ncbi:MAG: DeoR family transcriptional regulator [Akkermansiaceae bacterium]|nr:DeoR family transcriptional regulator [Akkermansiaceae bacterium]
MYLPDERRACILRLLEERGSLRTASLARELCVTDESIRNDFICLERQGLLERFHGGARHVMPGIFRNVGGETRLGVLLARRIVPLLPPRAALFLEESLQTFAVIAELARTSCTIVSNSPRILGALSAPCVAPECVSTGGRFDKEAGIYAGEVALRAALAARPDCLVLSPESFSPERGCGYGHLSRARMMRELARAIPMVFLICPASRFVAAAPFETGALPIHTLATEDGIPQEAVQTLRSQGVRLELIPSLSPEDLREMREQF